MSYTPIDEFILGSRVKYFRKSRKLTQKALAKKCNISQSALAQIEKSEVMPGLRTLRDLARELDVEVAVLFSKEDVVVLNLKKLKTKYKKRSDLTESLARQLVKVVAYCKALGIE